jgi:hypothetical protein
MSDVTLDLRTKKDSLLMSSRSGALGPLALFNLLSTADFWPGISSDRRNAPISAPCYELQPDLSTHIARERTFPVPQPLCQGRNLKISQNIYLGTR